MTTATMPLRVICRTSTRAPIGRVRTMDTVRVARKMTPAPMDRLLASHTSQKAKFDGAFRLLR